MKLSKVVLSAAIAAAFAASGVQAASNGIINFTGEVVDKTCDIKIDGSVSPATVALPKVSKSLLATSGATTGRTGFNIQLSNCSGSASITKAAAFFENGATVNPSTFRLVNTLTGVTAATNVELQLLDASAADTPIQVGNTSQIAGTTKVTIDSVTGSANLPYAVRYYATGAATAGLVTSSVNFTIDYE